MIETGENGGRFEQVRLRPQVTISAGDAALAMALHHQAHENCFIASSVNFEVACDAEIIVA